MTRTKALALGASLVLALASCDEGDLDGILMGGGGGHGATPGPVATATLDPIDDVDVDLDDPTPAPTPYAGATRLVLLGSEPRMNGEPEAGWSFPAGGTSATFTTGIGVITYSWDPPPARFLLGDGGVQLRYGVSLQPFQGAQPQGFIRLEAVNMRVAAGPTGDAPPPLALATTRVPGVPSATFETGRVESTTGHDPGERATLHFVFDTGPSVAYAYEYQ
jgi:hypothetical protein